MPFQIFNFLKSRNSIYSRNLCPVLRIEQLTKDFEGTYRDSKLNFAMLGNMYT